jgi:hypothetical protein
MNKKKEKEEAVEEEEEKEEDSPEFSLSIYKDTARSWPFASRRRALTGNYTRKELDLGLPAPGAMRKSMLFKPPTQSTVFCYGRPRRLQQ